MKTSPALRVVTPCRARPRKLPCIIYALAKEFGSVPTEYLHRRGYSRARVETAMRRLPTIERRGRRLVFKGADPRYEGVALDPEMKLVREIGVRFNPRLTDHGIMVTVDWALYTRRPAARGLVRVLRRNGYGSISFPKAKAIVELLKEKKARGELKPYGALSEHRMQQRGGRALP